MIRTALTFVLLGLLAWAPTALAQVALLDPGENAFRVGSGVSWGTSVQGGVFSVELGGTVGRLELALAHARFPEDPSHSIRPEHASGVAVGYALVRTPNWPQTIGVYASVQQTAFSRLTALSRVRDQSGVRALTLGTTVAFPVIVEPSARVVPAVRAFWISRDLTGPGWHSSPADGEPGWGLSLGVRTALPGPFDLVLDPSLAYTQESGLVRGVTLGLMTAGRRLRTH